MKWLGIPTLVMAVVLASSPVAQAQEPGGEDNVVECTDVLEAIYGVAFEDCTPGTNVDCYQIGGVDIVCAWASASIEGPFPEDVSDNCPSDGNYNPDDPDIYCWDLSQYGQCWGLLPGQCTTVGWIADPCFWGAASYCQNEPDGPRETSVQTADSVLTKCFVVTTTAVMPAAPPWPAEDEDCAP